MWEYMFKLLEIPQVNALTHIFSSFDSRSHVSTVTSLLHSLGPNVSAAPTLRKSTALHRPANSASSSVPSTGRMRAGERWPITCTLLFSLITHPHSGCVLLNACVWCDSSCSDRLKGYCQATKLLLVYAQNRTESLNPIPSTNINNWSPKFTDLWSAVYCVLHDAYSSGQKWYRKI